jgi:lipoprotein-anchoring transpeptidase ErfK/SrfK
VKLVLSYTTQDGRYQEVVGEGTLKLRNFADNGIARATAALKAPATLEPGATLKVTADVTYLEAGKACTATWYVDGKPVSNQSVVLGKDIPTLSYNYTYTEKMNLNSQVKLVLSYTTQDGRYQEVMASTNVKLKNYGYLYYHDMTEEELLKMVTSTYAGNYTLKWAQEHDYDPEIKTAWVNLKGYSSQTEYLVWVNLTYQRVNIFKGSQGNWELVRECLCGSGAPATPTIKGVFTTSYKQTAWDYGSYYCGPIVRFYGSSGYAFHSRLEYWPMNSDRYYDASIGYPVSHGCLRMYNDDIWFMYNNIRNGTTVVVH